MHLDRLRFEMWEEGVGLSLMDSTYSSVAGDHLIATDHDFNSSGTVECRERSGSPNSIQMNARKSSIVSFFMSIVS